MHQTLHGEPLVQVTRGDLVESIHEVAACAMDASGNIVFRAGTIDAPVYLRSTAKPFIAAASVRAGVVERFGLTRQEIAVMAASHSGEPFHIAAVRSILQKIGMDESALKCGAHPPYNLQAAADLEAAGITPGAVHNNCSGKHAGILALCTLIGADPATYLDPANPAQQLILALCARVSDEDAARMPLGVDGCGIPVYATPLKNAALSFMRLATLAGVEDEDARALEIVRDAMVAAPKYIAGTGEFDTRLMEETNGGIACKGGAEGVHGSAVMGCGGLVTKVIDGNSRGRAPGVMAILSSLGWIDAPAAQTLNEFANPQLHNRAGTHVGQVRGVV